MVFVGGCGSPPARRYIANVFTTVSVTSHVPVQPSGITREVSRAGGHTTPVLAADLAVTLEDVEELDVPLVHGAVGASGAPPQPR